MPAYCVTPNDTLFFRGGEPMGIGESHFQTSVFPPSPETFVGAVRTTVIAHNCDSDFHGYASGRYADTDWVREIGMRDLPDTFRFTGPFLKEGNRVFLPPPANLFRNLDGTKLSVASPKQFPEVTYSSAVPEIMWLKTDGKGHGKDWKPMEEWISLEGMAKYLQGSMYRLKTADFIVLSGMFRNEERIGIAINGEGLRTARKGHLYCTAHKRFFEGNGMVFLLDGVPSFPDATLIRLGGENRTAWCERIDDMKLPSVEGTVDFLVTVMPVRTARRGAGVPVTEFLDEDLNVILPGGVRSKLLSYAVGKPVLFGGWDMAEKKAKEMIQYVPAGSVFYFEKCDVKGRNDKYLLGGSDVH
jgi:CRISPR-associated protein Cmr3